MSTPTENGQARRQGYMMLAALILTALAIFNLPALVELTRRHVEVVALVEEAPAVRIGTRVWAQGVKVGQVKGVQIAALNDTTLVALDLRLEPGALALVTADSDVRVVRQRLIGEPAVRLSAGAPGDPPLQAGDTLVGKPRISPQDLLDRAAALPATLDSLIVAAREVEAALEARRPRIAALADQAESVLQAASALTRELDHGTLGPLLDPDSEVAVRIASLRGRVAQLQAAVGRLEERYSPDSEDGLAPRLSAVADRARAVEAALAGIQEDAATGEGILWRLGEDPALQKAVEGVQVQIDSLTAEAWSVALRMFLPRWAAPLSPGARW